MFFAEIKLKPKKMRGGTRNIALMGLHFSYFSMLDKDV